MAVINPYIHFNGNAEEAFTFYKSVFGNDFASIVRFKDMKFEGAPNFEKEAEKIMHIALPIGRQSVLMGSDTPEQMGKHNEMETRSKIFISTESKQEANNIFNGLSKGGQVEMPMEDSPWGTILECSGINLVLNGWWNLTENSSKFNSHIIYKIFHRLNLKFFTVRMQRI